MLREEIEMVRRILPETEYFHYIPDRESLWLLSELMPDKMRVQDLRETPIGKLLIRPSVKPVVAASGGMLRKSAVRRHLSETVYQSGWRDYVLNLDQWAVGQRKGWEQVSRCGGNLVLQIGFPAEHGRLFHRYMKQRDRKQFEFDAHPIRTKGAPTMAWVRLDVCLETGVALIEEIQSDWFREVKWQRSYLHDTAPRSRALKNLVEYEKQLIAAYGKDWSKAALLAALVFLRRELGVREVYMHQAWSGPQLKSIPGTPPPVSLYTKLPRTFCFEPTTDVPDFLAKPCSKVLRRLRAKRKPLFWKLVFTEPSQSGF